MKRFLSLLLILCLVAVSSPCVLANSTDNIISCGEAFKSENGTVCVPIQIANNTGFMGFSIRIGYNTDALRPISVVAGEVLSAGSLNDSIGANVPGSMKVVWIHSENVFAEGDLFIITFRVLTNTAANESITISYNQDDTFNEEWQDVVFHCINGNIPANITSVSTDLHTVISVPSEIMAGEQFDLPVIFERSTELMGFNIMITYDSTVFSPLSVTRGSAFSSGSMNDNIETACGTLKVVWTGTENVTSDGNAFVVRFSSNNITDAGQYKFGISYVQADTFNESWKDVVLSCQDTTVTLKSHHENYIYSLENKARASENVSIPISIKNNKGFMGFAIKVNYDENVFEPVSVSAGNSLPNGILNDSIGVSPIGSFRVFYTASSNVYSDGTLFTITFAVHENARGNSSIDLSYIQADTFNEEWTDVALFCEDVTIEIINADFNNAPYFYADRISAQAGSNMTVLINLANSCEMTSFSLSLEYDQSLFTPISVTGGEAITGAVTSDIETLQPGTLTITWNGETPILNDGTVLNVVFALRGYAQTNSAILLICHDASFAGFGTNPDDIICESIIISIDNPYADEPSQVYADPMEVVAGEHVCIPVYIRNNHGIMGLGINVGYDASVLLPVMASKGSILQGGTFENSIETSEQDSFKLIWSGNEDIKEDGQLIVLEFAALPNAAADQTTVTLTYNQADTFNEKWQDVILDFEPLTLYIDHLCVNAFSSSIYEGDTLQLSALYRNGSRPVETITWSTSNTAIASIDPDGLVKANRRGNVTIMAADVYGNVAEYPLAILSERNELRIFSYDGSFEQKVDWWKKYSTATMRLGFLINNCKNAVRYVWSTNSWRVNIDQQGNITNSGPFARSAKIWLTAYDRDNNVVAETSVTVRFYKFNWQYKRLQSQEIVSDNAFRPTVESTATEPETLVSFVTAFLSKVFWLFIR